MEGREDQRYGGGEGVRNAPGDVPVPGGDLRESQVIVGGGGLQECVLFCKWQPHSYKNKPTTKNACLQYFFKKISVEKALQESTHYERANKCIDFKPLFTK